MLCCYFPKSLSDKRIIYSIKSFFLESILFMIYSKQRDMKWTDIWAVLTLTYGVLDTKQLFLNKGVSF